MAFRLWPPQKPDKRLLEPAVPTFRDPLNDDPTNIPSLVGPQVFYSAVAANFMPAVRDVNVVCNTDQNGSTMDVQPVLDYSQLAGNNVAVGAPNMITGAPPSVRMSQVMRAFEEQLLQIQNMLLGAP